MIHWNGIFYIKKKKKGEKGEKESHKVMPRTLWLI